MSSKKRRLTGRTSRDLPLPAEHDVKGGDGKVGKLANSILSRFDESTQKVISRMRD